MWALVFLKVLFNTNTENYEKELWKTYVVSMPSSVIIIILGQTLSNRIVWGSPQIRLGEKCSSKLQCLWFEGNPWVINNNLVLFGCNIKSYINRILTEREGQYSPVRPEQARLASCLLYGTLFLIVKCTSGGLHLKGFRRDVFVMTRATQTKASYHEFEKQIYWMWNRLKLA